MSMVTYRKQRSSWWIHFFNDLHESDILDLTSDLHKEAIWFCFADLLQTDLDKVKEYWNSHRIRKSKHAIVSGVPDMMYFLPEDFGHTDCLISILPHKFTEMENNGLKGSMLRMMSATQFSMSIFNM